MSFTSYLLKDLPEERAREPLGNYAIPELWKVATTSQPIYGIL